MSDAEQPAESETHDHHDHDHEGPGYATPQAAIEAAEPEQTAYVMGLHVGQDVDAPDFLAVVDLDPDSDTYSEIINRVQMPNKGDELHHFGWNACSSSCHMDGLERRHLVIPGQRSSRIHIVDTKERRDPELTKVIEPEEVYEHDLSAPHTVHCIPDGEILISMLGDADGDLPGGFLELNDDFEVQGRWDPPGEIEMNYDYWYQPRQNVMLSTEWAAPKTYYPGFDLDDVEDGKYGQRLNFWDWEDGVIEQTIDLGEDGLIPLEARFLHTPESTHGYVGAALSSNIIHFHESDGRYHAEPVIEFDDREHEGWDMPVPALVTDILISMDDRYLFGSSWLHGEVWMYDISDPSNPRKADSISIGGYFGDIEQVQGRDIVAGPQMLQLSLDGERLYWTTSLFSSWDNQFFPEEAEKGSVMLKADVDPRTGTMSLDRDFLVDFGDLPEGPARAHEIRWPDGDCTSDVWQ
ncbi:selenium-binding protein [Haloarcula marismortui ATCC 43049]|uniref:Selenium-binding protein n=1 Tax=Haloarcula marismortui (strain ATCC 43049 / DSM 3752 / JCM 8966 / VKM B-1809) TaxID=272569 RepID=Q5V0D5_HALMA|nr:selenium-binding family protein [Haloarcula marismortui]AAV47018.1 selenium-binding protein [Haloarcula marismortui ATCC 43049]QCP91718.1 selenium-binding protein [Haloarcula marismortui ATCC 43049]